MDAGIWLTLATDPGIWYYQWWSFRSSEMLVCVDCWVVTDGLLTMDCLTSKMKALWAFVTLVTDQLTWYNIQQSWIFSHIMSLFFIIIIFKCGIRFCPLLQCEVWIGQILYHAVLIDECKQYWDGRIHDRDWWWVTNIRGLSWVCCAAEIFTLLSCYVVLICG